MTSTNARRTVVLTLSTCLCFVFCVAPCTAAEDMRPSLVLESVNVSVDDSVCVLSVDATARSIRGFDLAFLIDTTCIYPADDFLRSYRFSTSENSIADWYLESDTIRVSLACTDTMSFVNESIAEVAFILRNLTSTSVGFETQLTRLPWPDTNVDESEAQLEDGFIVIGTVGVTAPNRIETFALFTNYPNPFNPSTTIRFGLPESGAVSLTIYDVNGRLVRTLVSSYLAAGMHEVVWGARDDAGRAVANGVYVYRLNAGEDVAVRRMVLVR